MTLRAEAKKKLPEDWATMTKVERAQFFLSQEITGKTTLKGLEIVSVACVFGDVERAFTGYHETEEQAIVAAKQWLENVVNHGGQ